jgi:hypothetical protein
VAPVEVMMAESCVPSVKGQMHCERARVMGIVGLGRWSASSMAFAARQRAIVRHLDSSFGQALQADGGKRRILADASN